jgi:hypothetical protein
MSLKFEPPLKVRTITIRASADLLQAFLLSHSTKQVDNLGRWDTIRWCGLDSQPLTRPEMPV